MIRPFLEGIGWVFVAACLIFGALVFFGAAS